MCSSEGQPVSLFNILICLYKQCSCPLEFSHVILLYNCALQEPYAVHCMLVIGLPDLAVALGALPASWQINNSSIGALTR